MKPLDQAKLEELTAAEKAWSRWLAMEDWMVGPRAPDDGASVGSTQSADAGGAVGGHLQHELPDGVGDAFRRHH